MFALLLFTGCNFFLWVRWVLAKEIFNFSSLPRKLDNPYCHSCYCGLKIQIWQNYPNPWLFFKGQERNTCISDLVHMWCIILYSSSQSLIFMWTQPINIYKLFHALRDPQMSWTEFRESPKAWRQPMLLYWKLVDETQMGNPRVHAARDISSKFSLFLPLRDVYFPPYHYETPCIFA